MKRLIFAVSLIAASLELSAQANQCPGCAINAACDNPSANFPALCPAILPTGTQGQAYSEDLTFFMPYIIDAEGFTGLHLEEVTVVGISGIPAGMSWTTSHYPTNFYDVTSDVSTQRGCAKICGTPLLSGAYTPTVNVVVKVCNIPIVGCTTLTQTFVLPLQIDAVAGGNPYFSYSPEIGCGSVDVTFNGLLNLGTPQVTEYDWQFDNGNTSTLQNPPVQTYSAAGEYHPSLTTNVYNYVFDAMTANVTGGWWCGDIEELNCGAGNADLKFTLTHGTDTYNGAEIDNTLTPSWSALGVVLSNLTIGVQFTEVDNISASDNGGTFAYNVPGAGVYNYSTTAVTSGGGGVNGTFTIVKSLFNSYAVTDTVRVFALPPAVPITSSTGSFTMCGSSPITMSVYGGYTYEWYLNDTTSVPGAIDSAYTIPDPGFYPYTATYKVKITDPVTGCSVTTPNVSITVNEGIPSLFGNVGATYNLGQLSTNYSGFASYQWMLNGTPLVPSGQSQTITPTVNGNYTLIMTNSFGCSDTSNTIAVFNLGIENASALDLFTSVFPNPSNGMFTLNMEIPVSTDLTVSLVDISGKTVHQEYLGKISGTLNKTFDLTTISAGVYTLNITLDQGTIRRKLIIR